MVITPGSSSDSCEKLRPLSGMPWMVVSETTSPTTASCVWRMGVTPVDLDALLEADLHRDVDARGLAGLEL